MATAEPAQETYDLLIVTDATASMGGYLDALRESIPEILALAKLSGAFSRLGVLAYKDYCDPSDEIAAWSGWNAPTLPQFVRDLKASGGGDYPEAAKTALIRGLQAANKGIQDPGTLLFVNLLLSCYDTSNRPGLPIPNSLMRALDVEAISLLLVLRLLAPSLYCQSSRLPLEPTNIPLRSSTTDSFDPGKRFAIPSESAFRDLVYESLTSIIQTNVACLTYNPVFGQLWRAVCKDTDSRKTVLVNLFSEYVGKVSEAAEKAALRQWLEESFDQTEEIEKIIKRHCAKGPTQMVYLDFDADVHLTRTELLEVSRSCYAAVLKKIARVFTHLKLVEPGVTLAPQQRSIPLTLPPRDFYRLLPHLISRGKWLDLEVPENISFDCARFLLSAPSGVVLTERERGVYEAMRRYKLIELNLDAPVEVNVPWTPQKTRGPGDVKVQCVRCSV
ncbi:RING-type domain-containing protein [Mycena venus]|uniref:RING-type domain-containing protein n=1 Tax=Mycena venus TaxID=2733690 RepID=A0A8H7CHI4_9AGAR|nr:RING-type domain-containing protein [Mycena venus]